MEKHSSLDGHLTKPVTEHLEQVKAACLDRKNISDTFGVPEEQITDEDLAKIATFFDTHSSFMALAAITSPLHYDSTPEIAVKKSFKSILATHDMVHAAVAYALTGKSSPEASYIQARSNKEQYSNYDALKEEIIVDLIDQVFTNNILDSDFDNFLNYAVEFRIAAAFSHLKMPHIYGLGPDNEFQETAQRLRDTNPATRDRDIYAVAKLIYEHHMNPNKNQRFFLDMFLSLIEGTFPSLEISN